MTRSDCTGDRFAHHLAKVLSTHFDPEHGTPYWIEYAERLGFDPRIRIKMTEDLDCFGLMDRQALCSRPLTDFVPRGLARRLDQLIVVQTGGTLGEPIWTAYTRKDYHAAFVRPFIAAARHVGFPSGGTWLYVGPSGPHVIGRAARSIARATGAMDPFTVDFDSRWAKKLPLDSFAAQRYLQHVVNQAMEVVRLQEITHLFSTPPILAAVGTQMSVEQRSAIHGVHYGGMAIAPDELLRLQRDVFPNAVHLSGYGNTLFGCCLELDTSPGRNLQYFPWGRRILFGVLPEGETRSASILREPGARGRCVFTRLDCTMLLINYCERDEMELTPPPCDGPNGFASLGVRNPQPIRADHAAAAIGLY